VRVRIEIGVRVGVRVRVRVNARPSLVGIQAIALTEFVCPEKVRIIYQNRHHCEHMNHI